MAKDTCPNPEEFRRECAIIVGATRLAHEVLESHKKGLPAPADPSILLYAFSWAQGVDVSRWAEFFRCDAESLVAAITQLGSRLIDGIPPVKLAGGSSLVAGSDGHLSRLVLTTTVGNELLESVCVIKAKFESVTVRQLVDTRGALDVLLAEVLNDLDDELDRTVRASASGEPAPKLRRVKWLAILPITPASPDYCVGHVKDPDEPYRGGRWR